jgi:RNA polymerase sigma-70 factor, ECF subfamily
VTARSPLTESAPAEELPDRDSATRPVAALPRPTLRQVFDEHASYVWRTLRHLGVGEADLEDVCQDVFVAVHRKLDGFEGRSSLRTWIYGIALRVASDYRRRAHVRRELPVADLELDAAEPTQLEDIARGEARRLLLSLLDRLDDDKRAVLVLYELEELGMKEVAEIVGCPLQTAYSRLHAARRLLFEAGKAANDPERER